MNKETLKLSLILFVICAVVTLSLSYLNEVTQPLIAKLQIEQSNDLMKKVLPSATRFDEQGNAFTVDGIEVVGYKGYDQDGNVVGYVLSSTPRGYAGKISVVTGVDKSFAVTGVEIGDNKETPGLGTKAKDAKFKNQFIGKKDKIEVVKGAPIRTKTDVTKGETQTPDQTASNRSQIDTATGATQKVKNLFSKYNNQAAIPQDTTTTNANTISNSNNQIAAITGATVTSKAVTKGVNAAIAGAKMLSSLSSHGTGFKR